MSQPQPIIIDINQLDNPIYISLPMPTIILQIPSARMILSHEFGNWYHSAPNNRCTHCGRPESKEDEADDDDTKEVLVDNGDMDKEEIKIEEIKEEMVFQYPYQELYGSSRYTLPHNVNIKEPSLSPLSEANIKDETHDWEKFSIEYVGGKNMKMESIIS